MSSAVLFLPCPTGEIFYCYNKNYAEVISIYSQYCNLIVGFFSAKGLGAILLACTVQKDKAKLLLYAPSFAYFCFRSFPKGSPLVKRFKMDQGSKGMATKTMR